MLMVRFACIVCKHNSCNLVAFYTWNRGILYIFRSREYLEALLRAATHPSGCLIQWFGDRELPGIPFALTTDRRRSG